MYHKETVHIRFSSTRKLLFSHFFHFCFRVCMNEWLDAINSLITLSPASSKWLTEHLASEEGLKLVTPYLLESTSRDVRINFSQLLDKCLSSEMSHSQESDQLIIIQHIVSLLRTHVADNIKLCAQYFWLLLKYAQMVCVTHPTCLIKSKVFIK